MKLIVLLIIFFTSIVNIHAQVSSPRGEVKIPSQVITVKSPVENVKTYEWQPGEIVLKNNDTLAGNLSYYNQKDLDLIALKRANKVQTFAPKDLKMFGYYDSTIHYYRYFRVFEVSDKRKQKKEIVLEQIVMEGALHYLQKSERFEYGSVRSQLYSEGATERTHYFLFKGKLIKIINFKKQMRQIAQQQGVAIDQLAKESAYSYNNSKDRAMIVILFNEYLKRNQ